MKSIARFLLALLCVAPFGAANAVVSSTAGNNLTAYNGESGATNNNRWNTLMNSRSGGNDTAAVADFGNCNAIVMRCAQPKCSSGGCTDLNVTYASVSGCVQSNEACKQYGDELTQYISAQLVAQSTARANDAANAASAAAAEAAAAQSAQQMAAMQAQMQQMQSEMAAQNAATVAQLQSALEEQKQMTANAIAEATAARETQTIAATPSTPAASNTNVATAASDSGLTGAQLTAAQNGVSADILAREQISGQIMSSIENAEVQLKKLKATMNDVFSYAGCDSRGNNCTGPKRIKTFKQKAEGFFDPYESVLDELYDALVLAQSVGVDITDIYMMLNGSCNVWGQYLCSLGGKSETKKRTACDKIKTTTGKDGDKVTEKECHEEWYTENGDSFVYYKDGTTCRDGKSVQGGRVRGGHECSDGAVVPPEDDTACVLNKTIVDDPNNPVQRDWLWAESNTDSGANIRVGCASSALESSMLFRNRKKQAKIDIETLEKMLAQDAPATASRTNSRGEKSDRDVERVQYCSVGNNEYAKLQKWIATKSLPKNVCMSATQALTQVKNDDALNATSERAFARAQAAESYNKCKGNDEPVYCSSCGSDCKSAYNYNGVVATSCKSCKTTKGEKCCLSVEGIMCLSYANGKEWTEETKYCQCDGDSDEIKNYRQDKGKCMKLKDYCEEKQTMPISDDPKNAKENDCWASCTEYCTKSNVEASCNISAVADGKKCTGSWDDNNKKCKCTVK